MKRLVQNFSYDICSIEELTPAQQKLIAKAKAACETSYAPYSKFSVGAAILLESGEIVCGSNQENAAYPSGTCAERTAMFYANSQHKGDRPVTIAIAAKNTEGLYTASAISPCGSCRQVLIESQHRYGKPISALLYGENGIVCLESVSQLLPFQFDADAMYEK